MKKNDEFKFNTIVCGTLLLLFFICLVPGVMADEWVGGIPLTTVQTGTVTGDLWMDIDPAPNWGSNDVTKTFTLPAAAVAEPGRIKWARLYISAYCGHMQNDYAFHMDTSFDGDGIAGYEHVWPETAHERYYFATDPETWEPLGNDNSEFPGHGAGEPYLMLNDHVTRVTSDYFATYDVTDLIKSQEVTVNVNTVGSFDGRIKVMSLVVAYDDPASTTETTYWVNEGHDVCSYYVEDNYGDPAVGTTTFATTGLSDIDSATLYIDYMASNIGYFGFPTDDNDFKYVGGMPPVTGTFTNHALPRNPDVQGPYSGVIHYDVLSDIDGSSDVTFAYSRYFPATGTAAFFKIPLAILVVKEGSSPPAPVADFSADDTTSAIGQTVTFTDLSTNNPTSWAWTIGGTENTDYKYVDSTTSASQNPHVQFLVSGTYDVTLVATNAGGSDTKHETDFITVTASATAPVADFSATPVTGNSPLTVTFTDQSTNNPAEWLWDFGDGNTSTDQNPSHQYYYAGYYTVKLTATNGDGSDDEIKADFITAMCDFQIGGIPVPSGGGANVFANEENPIQVTLVKNNVGNHPDVKLWVYATADNDDNNIIWSNNITIPAGTLTSSAKTIDAGVDPTIRTVDGGTVKYWAVIDPDNEIPETSETNNKKVGPWKTVFYNGYKGVQYWNGKEAPKTWLTFDIHGDVIHSFGDSFYKSGKGSIWKTLTWTWTTGADPDPDDTNTPINIPEGATVKAARLYIPYCWDVEKEMSNGTATFTFNSETVTPLHFETDTSNFGAYAQYEYGLFTFDVTDLYVRNGNNTATLTRYYDGKEHTSPSVPGQPGSLSPAGFTLMVIYEDQSMTRKQIFINEGWDLLGASLGDYATSEEEATSYQEFTGMTIDMNKALNAQLTTFVPWGAPQGGGKPGEGNLFVNGVQIGHNVWNYGGGSDTWGESGQPQVAVDTRDILSYLNLNGTGNSIAIQSTEGASPCMVAERAFLVVEYPTTTVTAPVAAFSADDTTPDVGQTVVFTDQSTNTPTSWAWFIEGTAGTDYEYVDSTTSASQNPHVKFLVAGTYDVKLTATNSAGSDDEEKTGYITVTSAVTEPVAQFSANPTSGTAPLTVQFTDQSTGSITSYAWDFNNDGTVDSTAKNPSHRYTTTGTFTVKLTVTGPGGSDSEVKTGYITVTSSPVYPDINWTRPPYPEVTKMQPVYPDIDWTRPPYPEVTKMQPVYPDIDWIRPPYPEVTKMQPVFSDVGWIRPSYLDWLWNRHSITNLLRNIFG